MLITIIVNTYKITFYYKIYRKHFDICPRICLLHWFRRGHWSRRRWLCFSARTSPLFRAAPSFLIRVYHTYSPQSQVSFAHCLNTTPVHLPSNPKN